MKRWMAWLKCSALLLCTACRSDCWIADQATIVDERNGLFLVYRVTGFQDKAQFFQVYGERPTFTACGEPQNEPIADEYYERSRKMLKGIRVRGKRMTIVYTSKRSEAVEPLHARLLP